MIAKLDDLQNDKRTVYQDLPECVAPGRVESESKIKEKSKKPEY